MFALLPASQILNSSCHGLQMTAPAPIPSPQRLDATCAAVAQAGLAVQLAAVLWRLLGQLLALEGLVFVLFKPRWLAGLHGWLARAVVHISGALHRAGASGRVMDIGARRTLAPRALGHAAARLQPLIAHRYQQQPNLSTQPRPYKPAHRRSRGAHAAAAGGSVRRRLA
jgi:hypothetical protein